MISRVFIAESPGGLDPGSAFILWTNVFRGPPGVAVYCPPSRAIMLDPNLTAPGASIAISLDGAPDRAQVIGPGDVATFEKPIHSFRAWNAAATAFAGVFTSYAGGANFAIGNRGRVGFLVAPEVDAFRDRQARQARFPLGFLGTAQAQAVAGDPNSAAPGTLTAFLLPPNIRGIRVSTFGGTAAATYTTPSAADFAVTLRPYFAPVGRIVAGNGLGAWSSPLAPIDEIQNPAGTNAPFWLPASELDFAFAAENQVITREMTVPGGLMTLVPIVLAGAGVSFWTWALEVY